MPTDHWLKYVREFYTPVCYCGDISTHRNVMLNETNCDWLFDMSVKRPHGRALANKSCHRFQTFSHQSEGLATRDYQGHDCWDYSCGWPEWAPSICSDVVLVIEEEILVIWGCNTLCTAFDYLGLTYCCTFVVLIASIVLIFKSFWIKASTKWLNVNVIIWYDTSHDTQYYKQSQNCVKEISLKNENLQDVGDLFFSPSVQGF